MSEEHTSASRTRLGYINSCSILIFIPSMRVLSCDASLVVMEHAMTGRDTPQARPRATLLLRVGCGVWGEEEEKGDGR